MTKRRDLLLTGLALAGVAAGWQVWIRRSASPSYIALETPPGWRMIESGPLSGPSGADFLTLGQDEIKVEPYAPDALNRVLYKRQKSPEIAVFSDFFCPYCRTLTARLHERDDLAITWHELPLLGPPSEIAARAAIAADLQGRYAPFVAALASTGFRPTNRHMVEVARSIGLDGALLGADIEGPAVADRLAESRRAAATLGIVGTPAITVARTLVLGEIGMDQLDRVIGEART